MLLQLSSGLLKFIVGHSSIETRGHWAMTSNSLRAENVDIYFYVLMRLDTYSYRETLTALEGPLFLLQMWPLNVNILTTVQPYFGISSFLNILRPEKKWSGLLSIHQCQRSLTQPCLTFIFFPLVRKARTGIYIVLQMREPTGKRWENHMGPRAGDLGIQPDSNTNPVFQGASHVCQRDRTSVFLLDGVKNIHSR